MDYNLPFDKTKFKDFNAFYDYWHPKHVFGICDSWEEAIQLNQLSFPFENNNWTKSEVDDLFNMYRIEVNFPVEMKKIIEE